MYPRLSKIPDYVNIYDHTSSKRIQMYLKMSLSTGPNLKSPGHDQDECELAELLGLRNYCSENSSRFEELQNPDLCQIINNQIKLRSQLYAYEGKSSGLD